MKIIFSDFDGTLTNDGKLGAIFFDILNIIKKKKSELIIVSGRSLSWGHFFLTHFDFNFCIMEGGGVILRKDDKGEIHEQNLVSDEIIEKLDKLCKELQIEVPEVVMSKDSFGRRTDRAIEFKQMSEESILATENFLRDNKLNFSRSNVHINFWNGEISKARGVETFLQNFVSGVDKSETCFFGDAMNDESMFELFPRTIGVSNISEIIDQLSFKPSHVLAGEENAGAFGVYNYLQDNL